MLGVGGADASLQSMRLAGIAGWLACSLSMGVGEYVSVAAQTDSEIADIDKERAEQARGPAARAHEQDELTQIYVQRWVSSLSCLSNRVRFLYPSRHPPCEG